MIKKNEIQSVAKTFSLPQNSIEKDYILSWLLAGIYNRQALKDQWVFKGDTCIKKCFIETYRFSEDLDFTILDINQIDILFLQFEFKAISEWIYEHSGIEVPFQEIKLAQVMLLKNLHQLMYLQLLQKDQYLLELKLNKNQEA